MKRFIIGPACLFVFVNANAQNYFIDEHHLGEGNVRFEDVVAAHEKDLSVEGKHDVKFLRFWVSEEAGTVYCLSQAPDAHSIYLTHNEAHGLVPDHIMRVSEGEAVALVKKGSQLFLDVHHLSPGSVTAEAVAEAHKKDLAVEDNYGVRFLNYWVDEQNGTVVCLSESPDADAIVHTHSDAHGLLPDVVMKVKEGE